MLHSPFFSAFLPRNGCFHRISIFPSLILIPPRPRLLLCAAAGEGRSASRAFCLCASLFVALTCASLLSPSPLRARRTGLRFQSWRFAEMSNPPNARTRQSPSARSSLSRSASKTRPSKGSSRINRSDRAVDRADRVVPFAVKFGAFDIEGGHFGVGDGDALGICIGVEFAAHLENESR